MPQQIVPVTGLAQLGLIRDVPAVALPPNAFSDCNNVRFRDGAVFKMEGDINVLPNIQYDRSDILKYIVWWPNPNLSFANSGYYLIILEQDNADSTTRVDNAYIIQINEVGIELGDSNPELTPSSDFFKGEFQVGGDWQHTFFQGGFSLIINNGLETPHYLLDNEGNLDTASVGDTDADGNHRLLPLPGWDSYANVDGVVIATVTAGIIRSFGDFLVAGNLVERDSDDEVIRGLPGIIRSSDIAAPGAIPQNWNPFAVAVNTADEFTVTNDGIVQDMIELQGSLYIYSNSSISLMSRTNSPTVPLSVRDVTTAYGALTTDAVLEFDGRHFVVGSQDIYIFGGHPGSIKSVADGRVRQFFYDNLNPLAVDQTFVLRYQQKDEIWICYATADAFPGSVNRALIWNYRLDNWTQRDLVNVISGDVGPIPGGGVPTGSIGFSGIPGTGGKDDSGEDIGADDGVIKAVTLTQTEEQNIVRTETGLRHEYTIVVQGDLPESIEAEGLPVFYVTYDTDEFCTVDENDNVLHFQATGQNLSGGFLRLPNDFGEVDANFDYTHPLLDIVYDPDTETPYEEQVTYPILADLVVNNQWISWPRGSDPDDSLPLWFVDNRQLAGGDWSNVVRPGAPVQVHLSSARNIMVVTFSETTDDGVTTDSYTPTLRFNNELVTFKAQQLDRVDNNTIPSEELTEFRNFPDSEALNEVDGQTTVFHFDLVTTGLDFDNIDDHVFLMNNIPEGSVIFAGFPNLTEASQSPFFGGTRPSGDDPDDSIPSSPTIFDGANRFGSGFAAEGERRIYWDFAPATRTQLIGPITGEFIRTQLLQYDPDIPVTDFPLQVWVPNNETRPVRPTLVAFDYPTLAECTPPDVENQPFVTLTVDDDVDASDPPVIDFTFRFEEFYLQEGTQNWGWFIPPQRPNNPDIPTPFPLHGIINVEQREAADVYNFIDPNTNEEFNPVLDWFEDPNYNSGQETYRVAIATNAVSSALQKEAIANAIAHAFQSNPNSLLRAPSVPTIIPGTTEDLMLGIISEDPAAVNLVANFIGGEKGLTLGYYDSPDEFAAANDTTTNIVIINTVQGRHNTTLDVNDIDNSSPINPVRYYLPPIVEVTHAGGYWAAENVGPLTISLQPDDPTQEVYNVADWMAQIRDDIIEDTTYFENPLLSLDTELVNGFSLQAEEFPYTVTDSEEDYGGQLLFNVEDGFLYPARRPAGSWISSLVSTGNGATDDTDNDLFIAPSFSNAVGQFQTIAIPTYTMIQVSDPTASDGSRVYLFETTGQTTLQGYIEDLISQINLRIPAVIASTVDNESITIEPVTFTDQSEFVLNFVINDTANNANVVAVSIDPAVLSQDPLNPIPLGQYEDRLAEPVASPASYLSVATNADTTIATLAETVATAITDQVFDILRPWPRTQVNFAREFPLFASSLGNTAGQYSNKIIASDLGFSRPDFNPSTDRVLNTDDLNTQFRITVSAGEDLAEAYESYVERTMLGLSPEFSTERLHSIALWIDGISMPYYRAAEEDYTRARLDVRVRTTNNPGSFILLDETGNEYDVGADYKTDIRRTGRFMNIRVTDDSTAADNDTDPFNRQTEWRLSGMQLEVGDSGTR